MARLDWRRAVLVVLLALCVAAFALAPALPATLAAGGAVTGPFERSRPWADGSVRVGAPAPEFVGLGQWFNVEPTALAALRGQVVLVHFWTFECENCLNTMPYLNAWQARYGGRGLSIVGIHTPEFAAERVPENVARAVRRLGIAWAVAMDNDYATWNAYNTRYWPTKWLVDANGVLRHLQIGEGGYDETESMIQSLLREAGYDVPAAAVPHLPSQPLARLRPAPRVTLDGPAAALARP